MKFRLNLNVEFSENTQQIVVQVAVAILAATIVSNGILL